MVPYSVVRESPCISCARGRRVRKAMVFERPSEFLPTMNESNTVPCNYGIPTDTLLREERMRRVAMSRLRRCRTHLILVDQMLSLIAYFYTFVSRS